MSTDWTRNTMMSWLGVAAAVAISNCCQARIFPFQATFDCCPSWIGENGASWHSVNPTNGYWQIIATDAEGEAKLSAGNDMLGNWDHAMGLDRGLISYDVRIKGEGTMEFTHYLQISGTGGTARVSVVLPRDASSWARVLIPVAEPEWIVTDGTWAELLRNVNEMSLFFRFAGNTNIVVDLDNAIISRILDPAPDITLLIHPGIELEVVTSPLSYYQIQWSCEATGRSWFNLGPSESGTLRMRIHPVDQQRQFYRILRLD